MTSKGRIIEIKRESRGRYYGGVKGHQGYERTPYGYYNGYGGFNSYPSNEIIAYVKVYATDQVHLIDIRDQVLEETGVSRISQNMLKDLKNDNEGNKVWLETDEYGDWVICDGELVMP